KLKTSAPEEACGIRSPKRYFTARAKYTATLSSRLLLEAGWSENDETYSTNEAQSSGKPHDIRRVDRRPHAGARSYVTGTHAIKTGMQLGQGGNRHQRSLQNGVDLIQVYRLN